MPHEWDIFSLWGWERSCQSLSFIHGQWHEIARTTTIDHLRQKIARKPGNRMAIMDSLSICSSCSRDWLHAWLAIWSVGTLLCCYSLRSLVLSTMDRNDVLLKPGACHNAPHQSNIPAFTQRLRYSTDIKNIKDGTTFSMMFASTCCLPAKHICADTSDEAYQQCSCRFKQIIIAEESTSPELAQHVLRVWVALLFLA